MAPGLGTRSCICFLPSAPVVLSPAGTRDQTATFNPRERPRDFKRSQRAFVAEKSKCWIVPVCHFRSLKIVIVGEGVCKFLIFATTQ